VIIKPNAPDEQPSFQRLSRSGWMALMWCLYETRFYDALFNRGDGPRSAGHHEA
jgi:hypothetical protein